MRFDIISIFPDFFRGPFEFGVVPRAFRQGLASVHTHDLRAFTHDRHRSVDDRPFGGGEGMVLKPGPLFECVESLGLAPKGERDTGRESVVLLSPQGERFTQQTARQLRTLDRLVLLCGRYEGVDERVAEHLCDRELSIGDYVLSGGELGAAVILDAVVRLLPGVLGHADSNRYESFGEGEPTADEGVEAGAANGDPGLAYDQESSPRQGAPPPPTTHAAGGLLDYPQYTRPADFRGYAIPPALGNGDHSVIRRWRREAALTKTARNRPDLLSEADLSEADRRFLGRILPETFK